MIIIKRYANRKLYNTSTKRYITLAGIADLVRSGQDVQVIDHQTGEDLTSVTLAQVMAEREKQRGPVQFSLLSRFLQTSGERVSSLRRLLTHPEEMRTLVNEEIVRRLAVLSEAGALTTTEQNRLEELLLAVGPARDEVELRATIEEILSAEGVPSRTDLKELTDQLEALEQELDKLAANRE
jgi:polyhydroxyalkanoate synthesis repressor PhaR